MSRREVITLLVRNFENQGFLNAFVKYCDENDYELNVVVLENADKEATWRVHGDVVISAFESETIKVRAKAFNVRYACVQDVMKHFDAAEGLGDYLCNESHLVIRYLGSDVNIATMHMDGLKKAYHKVRQPHDYAIMISDGTYGSAYEKTKALFAHPLDLIIAQDALHAQAIYQYARDYHIVIPQHVSVVFFGTKEEAQRFSPLISGITYRYDIIVKRLMQEEVSKPRFAYLEGNSVK